MSSSDSNACSLFCGNVSSDVSDNDLRTLVGTAIPVSSVLSIRRLTAVGGGFRPIAFVDLADKALADKVIAKLHGKELKGKAMKCELSAKGPPADVLAKAGTGVKRAAPAAAAAQGTTEPEAKKQKVDEEVAPIDTSNMTAEEKKAAKKKEKRAKEKAKLKAKKAAASKVESAVPSEPVIAAAPKEISESEAESDDDVVMKTAEAADSDDELDTEIAKLEKILELEKKLAALKQKRASKGSKSGVTKIAPKQVKKSPAMKPVAAPVIDGTPTSVFVGNVDGSIREKALTDCLFKHCPAVSKTSLLGIRRLPNRDGGVRPMAFFDFTNAESAKQWVDTVTNGTITLAEKQLKAEISNKPPPMERWLNKPVAAPTPAPAVRNAGAPRAPMNRQPGNSNKASVFFGQLHQDTTESQLEEHIKISCPDVNLWQVRFLKDKNTGAFRRMAFVDVPDDAAAGEIIEKLHHSSLLGRRLNVEWTGVGRKNDALVQKQQEKRTEQTVKASAELTASLEKFYTCRSGKQLKEHFDEGLHNFLSTCAMSVCGKFLGELRKTSNEELEMRMPCGRESAWLMGVLRRHQSNSDTNDSFKVDNRGGIVGGLWNNKD